MKRILFLLALLALPAFCQNAALLIQPKTQFFDKNGKPLAGGLIYFCTAGTTCPGNAKTTYTDSTAVTPNPNPVVLDYGGFASIWISGTYKVVAQTSAGVQVWTADQVQNNGLTPSFSNLASGTNTTGAFVIASGSSLNAAGTGAINATHATTATSATTATTATTAGALTATPTLCSSGSAPTGVLANGNATGCASLGTTVQSISELGTCTTAAGANSTCTTSFTFVTPYSSLPTASCTLVSPFTGTPLLVGVAKTLTGLTVTITNGNVAAAVNAGGIDCLVTGTFGLVVGGNFGLRIPVVAIPGE